MTTRKIKDAKDLSTNELIYFRGHAQATYMSDGRTVEDVVNNAGGGGTSDDIRYFTDFTVEQVKDACERFSLMSSNDITSLVNAMQANKIICVPYRDYEKGYLIATCKYRTGTQYTSSLSILENGIDYKLLYSHNPDELRGDGVYPIKPITYELIDNDSEFMEEVHDNATYILCNNVESLYVAPSTVMPIGCTIKFMTGDNFTLGIANEFMWANGVIPNIEPNTMYELSIAEHSYFGFLAVLTPFKFIES